MIVAGYSVIVRWRCFMEPSLLPYRLPNIKNKRITDPHVVIVGAGASLAACKYDKQGREVPLLKNIHGILGLDSKLKTYGFSTEEMEDFELLYSNIYEKEKYKDLVTYLNNKVTEYFQSLEIIDEPTCYDYLILSLTEKDAIISFNWDPYLMQAYRRHIKIGNLPALIFPHGNVGVGICNKCHTMGYANTLCYSCLNDFENMPLLFPIEKKNYTTMPVIASEWKRARSYLSRAVGITVYGYGAPETDVEAVSLLQEAFAASNTKEIALFEMINLKSVERLQRQKWKAFYNHEMTVYCEKFEESCLWMYPRVCMETLFDANLQQHPRESKKSFKRFKTIKELQDFIETINEFELFFGG